MRPCDVATHSRQRFLTSLRHGGVTSATAVVPLVPRQIETMLCFPKCLLKFDFISSTFTHDARAAGCTVVIGPLPGSHENGCDNEMARLAMGQKEYTCTVFHYGGRYCSTQQPLLGFGLWHTSARATARCTNAHGGLNSKSPTIMQIPKCIVLTCFIPAINLAETRQPEVSWLALPL